MMKHKLLTIAIPHFDEIDNLVNTVLSLQSQYNEKVEVIVCDNGTGQPIAEAEELLKEMIPSLKIYSNSRNLGYDKNIDLCVERSSGTYVWFIGCGDTIPDNSVEQVVDVLLRASPTVNCVIATVTPEKKINLKLPSSDQELTWNWLPKPEAVALDRLYSSAVSGNIVRRDKWCGVMRRELEFKNWCHVERILQIVEENFDDKHEQMTLELRGLGVSVLRPTSGWWSENNCSFLYNFLTHIQIVRLFLSRLNLRSMHFCLPAFCKPSNIHLLKAVFYSATIPVPAEQKVMLEVRGMLKSHPLALLAFDLFNWLPAKWVFHLRRWTKKIATGLGLINAA